jgi:SAM-dependent methyltransferase
MGGFFFWGPDGYWELKTMTKKARKPWYEQDGFWDAFGPVIFDQERRGLASGEIQGLVGLLGLEPGQPVCDLCCGVGRHSVELARRGLDVTAVDRTRQYLDEAQSTARDEGLEIEFVEADMRDFCRPEAFDAVVNLFTSFGYFAAQRDDRRVAENMYRSLKAGGVLVIDTMSKEIIARVFSAREWRRVDGGILLEERKIVDGWSWIENCWTLIKNDQQHECTFSHRLYSAAELRGLLGEVGFACTEVYGGVDGAAYDEKAERMVVVGWK